MHVNEKVLCMSKDGTRIGYKKTRRQKITHCNHIFQMIRPSKPKQHISEENECTICCSSFENTGVYTAKCGHKFHLECIVTWYSKNTTCPLCRADDIEHPLMICMKENQ